MWNWSAPQPGGIHGPGSALMALKGGLWMLKHRLMSQALWCQDSGTLVKEAE